MISYLVFAGTIAGFYALLSLGLVTAWGQGGLVNLGLVGFVGLGAYTSALLSGAGLPIWIDWIAAAAVSAAVGVALCFVVRNLRGDYLAIVTLGFAEILRLAETNEKWLTKGSDGISGIVAPLKSHLGDYLSHLLSHYDLDARRYRRFPARLPSSEPLWTSAARST